jgi:hypothetical protein
MDAHLTRKECDEFRGELGNLIQSSQMLLLRLRLAARSLERANFNLENGQTRAMSIPNDEPLNFDGRKAFPPGPLSHREIVHQVALRMKGRFDSQRIRSAIAKTRQFHAEAERISKTALAKRLREMVDSGEIQLLFQGGPLYPSVYAAIDYQSEDKGVNRKEQ